VRTKDSCWSVGTIYDPRELPGVSTAVQGLDGVLQYTNIEINETKTGDDQPRQGRREDKINLQMHYHTTHSSFPP
jgi:hypothetical protein